MNRTFSLHDQTVFAELSGDFNPLHVDEVHARRLIFGRVLVHAVHGILWALDCWLAGRSDNVRLGSLRATFPRPIRLGDAVRCEIGEESEGRVELKLLNGREAATSIEAEFTIGPFLAGEKLPDTDPPPQPCRDRSATELADAEGSLPLALNRRLVAELFPSLQRLCPVQVAEILASTRLVGMECPGLHSVYSGLSLRFVPSDLPETDLTYRVTRCDPRFSRIIIQVAGPDMTGSINAFIRPAPQNQPTFAKLRQQVQPSEFVGQRALVVGGSRGIGETTAKLLAAGGAEVVVTYHRGADDAQRIVDQINANGGTADSIPFNALAPQFSHPERVARNWWPTHLYYFATPHIAAGSKGEFGTEAFREFTDYYVLGFLETYKVFRDHGLKYVFYPSSVFVDELPPNMAAYAAAKTAGEIVCRFLRETNNGLQIDVARLPRLATDQTASFLPVSREDPVPVMLERLRSQR